MTHAPYPTPPEGSPDSHDRTSEPFYGATCVVLHDRLVDLETGEVRGMDGDLPSDDTPVRLPPQPARLLRLLVDHAGEVVAHEQIREHLWPDTAVDFESGLHFCVRQVRSALGDTARDARFVETLPRRGYRLVVRPRPWPGVAAVDSAPLPDAPAAAHVPTRRSGTALLFAILLVSAVVIVGLRFRSEPTAASGEATVPRLAIMSMAPPAGSDPGADAQVDTGRVVHQLLLALGNDPERLVVLGPTSTAAYSTDLRQLQRVIDDLEVDWVLNARYVTLAPDEDDAGPSLFVELIRARDHAHVWVHRFEPPPGDARDGTAADRFAARIVEAIRAVLGPESSSTVDQVDRLTP